EARRLVVEVVARHEHVEAALGGGAIEVVTLHRAARRARDATCGGRDRGDAETARLLLERDDAKREPAARRERRRLVVRDVRVPGDPEADVEPGRVVAEVDEDVPEREAVFASRDGDQQPLLFAEHPLAGDGTLDLAAEDEQEARPAEGRVVRTELHLRGRATARALHDPPPEMTARISTSSASSSTSASVRRTSPRITMAVPGRTPSSASSCPTRRRPSISTMRCWGRR